MAFVAEVLKFEFQLDHAEACAFVILDPSVLACLQVWIPHAFNPRFIPDVAKTTQLAVIIWFCGPPTESNGP